MIKRNVRLMDEVLDEIGENGLYYGFPKGNKKTSYSSWC